MTAGPVASPTHLLTIDLDAPVSLAPCRLERGSGYRDDQQATEVHTADDPFPVHLDLAQLVP